MVHCFDDVSVMIKHERMFDDSMFDGYANSSTDDHRVPNSHDPGTTQQAGNHVLGHCHSHGDPPSSLVYHGKSYEHG